MVQLVLHAHMPYVLNSPMEFWLHEAVLNCYLPLVEMLFRCPEARIVLHVSPSLINQWAHPQFAEKFSDYCSLRKLSAVSYQGPAEALIRREIGGIDRFSGEGLNLLGRLADLKKSGRVELLTGAATHAFLPLWKDYPLWIKRQMEVGKELSRVFFGDISGFWFPECALDASLCGQASSCGLSYAYADPSCAVGKNFPIINWKGFTLFIRDRELGDLIWDAENGYPGRPPYRDFHADFGGEPSARLRGLPRAGFSLRAVGDRASAEKPYYRPEAAQEQVRAHARHFSAALPREKPCTLAFDAELFGHWWHEGIDFLENLFAETEPSLFKLPLEMPPSVSFQPRLSTWGTGCDASSWINPQTAPLIERLIQAQGPMGGSPRLQRAFMLAQASDWPFLITHGSFREDAFSMVENLLTRPPEEQDLLLGALKEKWE